MTVWVPGLQPYRWTTAVPCGLHIVEKRKRKKKKYIRDLEAIQQAATRYILHNSDSDYSQRFSTLNIAPLAYCREIPDLLFLSKCMRGSFKVCTKDFLRDVQPLNCNLRPASHCPLLKSQRSRTETFKMSYFNILYTCGNYCPKKYVHATLFHLSNVTFNYITK